MKNTIKMSLVAAVAVAGLTSNVAAKPLEEAIKNVDVSGSVLYRYNDYSNDLGNKESDTENYYKIATSIKSKVNDYVTATVRVLATNNDSGGLTKLDTTDNSDGNVKVAVSQANFTIKTDVATVIAGKQGLTTPWTVAIDSDGDEQTGTGILSLIPAGPVTVAAAYFNQTNLNTTGALAGTGKAVTEANIATLGLLGQAGPVALDAWYINLSDVLDSYTVGAKATIEGITASLRYTSVDFDANDDDNSLLDLKISAKVGPVGVWGQYAMTDKDGGTTALEDSAKTTIEGWNVTANGKADLDLFGIGADMDVMDGLNVALNYRVLDYVDGANDMDESELYTQITHKMGKNLVTYVRFGQYDKEVNNADTVDALRGRLQVEYKF